MVKRKWKRWSEEDSEKLRKMYLDVTLSKTDIMNAFPDRGMIAIYGKAKKMGLHRMRQEGYTVRHSEETKRKISNTLKGHKVPKGKDSHMWGRHLSEATRKKISDHSKILPGKDHHLYGTHHSKETRMKLSKSMKLRWKDETYAKNVIRGLHNLPTKPERELDEIPQKIFPLQYEYVGDGKIIIEGKCSDFINVDGQKKIIEMYGDYWHDKSDEIKRKALFNRFGYETLIVWEHELKDEPIVIEKIREFNKK